MSAGPAASGAALEAVLDAGGPALARRLRATEARLGEITAAGGAALAPHATETLAAGGKRLRPVLVFLCGDDSGGGGDEPADRADAGLVAAATAVELLHMATLVHDDVLDAAPLRRGRPTVFARGGRAAATATGDLLFSRAFAELAATGAARAVWALSEASSALARGELMQRADAWAAVGRERYLERCVLKTASLFAASCRLGAVLGGSADGSAGTESKLAEFGRGVGLAFQLLDDVLDVSGPAQRTGKHRGTDLLDGTVTLPLIEARRRDPAVATLDLRAEVTDPAAAERLCDSIAATGALDAVRAEALGHVADAKAILAGAALPPARRAALELVADGVVARYS